MKLMFEVWVTVFDQGGNHGPAFGSFLSLLVRQAHGEVAEHGLRATSKVASVHSFLRLDALARAVGLSLEILVEQQIA